MVKLTRPVKAAEEKPDNLGPTERKWMSWKSNALEALTVLQEDTPGAFDILVDAIAMGDKAFDAFAKDLDDMNMRGEQIVLAYEFAAKDLKTLVGLAAIRDKEMIGHVNANWKKAFIERAVPRGAHKWMHKKIVAIPNAT